jgi:outer membrane receptor protein involved in Fe transport
VFIIFLAGTLHAGTTGKISGTVIDEKTKEPVIGATILVDGTTIGASSDVEGNYVIPNVSPGTYSLAVSSIGFRKQRIQNVQVNVDFTTRINIQLSSEAVDLDAVVVVAERPLVRKDLTSSQTSVDANQIKALPVESIGQILSTQAGIIQDASGNLHFRGGRTNEVTYTVNGATLNNPFTNQSSISIATNAIQELSVVQGTFNAEYGNALSGVVETGLKEGGEKFKAQFTIYGGDRVSSHDNIFLNIKKIDPLSTYVVEGTIGGPLPGDFSFFTSARFDKEKGWLYGVREHTPEDQPDFQNDRRWIIPMSGDRALVPMNTDDSWTGTNRLSYKISASSKIGYDFIFNEARYRSYSHAYKYNPDGRYNNFENDVFHALDYSDLFDQKTALKIKFSYARNRYEQYRFKDLDSIHYAPDENSYTPVGSSFYFGGSQNGQYERVAETYAVKIDFSSIISTHHEVKSGFEARFPQLNLLSFAVLRDTGNYPVPTIPSVYDYKYNSYAKYPKQYSGFIQDKMEFESIVLNAGLRYDYFASRALYFVDVFHPEGTKKTASPKQMISPRLGISYPITDRGIIHFSYGHFFQMPQLLSLYQNTDFKTNPVGTTTYGNPNLNPEKNITYEVGLQQQLTDDLAFTITGFYKDVRDLIATQVIRISGEKTYNMSINKDYANIKGFTFSLVKRRTASGIFGMNVDYTLQFAEGNDISSSDAFFLDQQSGRASELVVVPLDWDQEQTLNATFILGHPSDWNVSVISRLGTGLPYTPYVGDNKVVLRGNSGRKPLQWKVDLSAEKEFSLSDFTLVIFARVYNLFDRLNENSVFDDTGRATYTLAPKRGDGAVLDQHVYVPGVHGTEDYFNNPTLYSAPRQILAGVTISL